MLGDEIEISATDRNGKNILDPDNKVFTFKYGQDGTTLQDFINKINMVFRSFDSVDGATMSLDQAGRLRLIANSAGEGKFSVGFTPKSDTNHVGTQEHRSSMFAMTAIPGNKINQLNGGTNMNYVAGDSINISIMGNTQTFNFATGDETLQDIVAFINTNYPTVNAVLAQGANPNQVQIVDLNGAPITISGTGTATGLNGTGLSFTLTSNAEPATVSTDLRNLLNMSLKPGDTINIVGTNPDGAYVSGVFTYGPQSSGTTVQDLLNTINKVFAGVTASMSPGGYITITDNAPGESKSTIALTSGTSVGFNIDFQTEIFNSKVALSDRFTGTTAVGTTLINNLNTTHGTPYQPGDVIEILASQMDGKTRKVSFKFGSDYDGDTIDHLINHINNSNEFPGMTASFSNGQIVFTDRSLNDLFDYTGIKIVNGKDTIGKGLETMFTTNAGTTNSNIKMPTFTEVQEGTTGNHHSRITVFDSAGQAHSLDITYTQDTTIGSNKWFWEILVDDGKIAPISGGSGTVTFNDNGTLKAFLYDNGSSLRFKPLGAEEMNIKLDGGSPGAFSGMTSMDAPSTNILLEQDGYQMGVLNNINIDATGVINGVYSNGVTKTLAQIAIANFTNEAGLQKEGHSLFSANGASGNPIVSWAGTNNKTQLRSGYLEASNVDLTDEFAKLIISQRALEANARVVNTADTILTTIIDRLKRM
jgi:flagellar hook-basal body protein